MNITVDATAKIATDLAKQNSLKQPTYSTTKMGSYMPQVRYILEDLHQYLQYIVIAGPMISYLLKKNH